MMLGACADEINTQAGVERPAHGIFQRENKIWDKHVDAG